MAVNREKQFNNLQHLVGSMKNPEPKHLVEAQIATEFHKDKRQEELIDQLNSATTAIVEMNRDLKTLKDAVDTLNADTATVYNRLYGRLNMLTTVMAVAAVVSCIALLYKCSFK